VAEPDHPLHEQSKPASPGAHYLFALVITLIVTGVAFLIKDATARWITVATAVVMDLGIVVAALGDFAKRARS